MKKQYLSAVALIFMISVAVNGQEPEKDKIIFKEKKDGFYQNEILKEIKELGQKEKSDQKTLSVDFSGYNLPKTIDEFTYYWHNDPISQGNTGTCWSFSTTSFYESEIYRQTGNKVKLSELWTVYWEYVEKAREFIKTRGHSYFAEGSESNAVKRIWKKYGIVPLTDYTGLTRGRKYHDHSPMFNEMYNYLQSVKERSEWNEEIVIETIKSILNAYLGTPPTHVEMGQRMMKPQEYLTEYLQFNVDDYVDIISYMQEPFYEFVEYKVPDNWWHNKDYFNVHIDEFMEAIKNAIRNQYTIVIGGDVSEPGKSAEHDVFIIPTFDIPAEYIDDSARQFRFSNNTTTDDHGIHLIGFKEEGDKDWFLIKDSGASARDGNNIGYYFFHEDYVKLKIMDFMVHKDAVKELLEKKTE